MADRDRTGDKGDIEVVVGDREIRTRCRLCGGRWKWAATEDGIGTAMAHARDHANDHLNGRAR